MEYLSLSYSQLLGVHADLVPTSFETDLKIGLLSNIIVHKFKEPLECRLMISGIKGSLTFGDYDSIVQNSFDFGDKDVVFVFWEAATLLPALHYKIEQIGVEETKQLIEKVKAEIKMVLDNLANIPLVIFNKFSARLFTSSHFTGTAYTDFVDELNRHLAIVKAKNTTIIDLDQVFLQTGIKNCVDYRFFYTSKAPYTFNFFKHYCDYIAPYICASFGKVKKALIFDCDNTLWKGIVGEDGLEGIRLSPETAEGMIFNEVQSLATQLSKKGVIIGLCSKNNIEDVEEVLEKHPDQVLKNEHLAIKKINWQEKILNLAEIASELNIGLESIVFIDDSPFELDRIRDALPQVTTIGVPKNINDYPNLIRKYMGLFFNFSITKEDQRKIVMYKEQRRRNEYRLEFNRLEDYLASLDLQIIIDLNDHTKIERLAQLTQKTNQFNARTIRYSESDVGRMISQHDFDVFSITVNDKFGQYGITGLCIISYQGASAFIDTFLLSCRVLSRHIEFKMIYSLINYLKKRNIETLTAEYLPTLKNVQIATFFDKSGFKVIDKKNETIKYHINIEQFVPADISYIKVIEDENGLAKISNGLNAEIER
ncbi:MAG: HAD-IIIC family phosphatase [Bacteroidota bacterium]